MRAVRPRDWMGPAASESNVTPDLLKEAGYRYVMDWPADDQPFWLQTRAGPILSVPYPRKLNDSAAIIHRDGTARDFADMIVDGFDEMIEQCRAQPLVMTISLHPFVMGQPFRLPALRRALTHCVEHRNRDRVWWTTPGAVADACYALPAGTIPGEAPRSRRGARSSIDADAARLDRGGPLLGLARHEFSAGTPPTGGRRATTVTPTSFSRSCTDGVFMVATVASWSFWTIGAGVPLGRKKPLQKYEFEIGEALLVRGGEIRQDRRAIARQDRDGLHRSCLRSAACRPRPERRNSRCGRRSDPASPAATPR